MDDFIGALQYQRDSNLLAEVHVALLRTIFGTPIGAGMLKNQATIPLWRKSLLEFLTKPKVRSLTFTSLQSLDRVTRLLFPFSTRVNISIHPT